jgi:hypothetical protein
LFQGGLDTWHPVVGSRGRALLQVQQVVVAAAALGARVGREAEDARVQVLAAFLRAGETKETVEIK